MREQLAKIPWPNARRAYDIACGTTLIPIAALLEISVLPCNGKWSFRNWELTTGPSLLMVSMILLLVNFAWITDLAMMAGQRKAEFHPLCVTSVFLSVITLLVMLFHLLENDDHRRDPEP